MSSANLRIDFKSDVLEFSEQYREAAETRLRAIADSHEEVDHATVAITKSREGERPEQFQARVMVNVRPDNITVTKKDYTIVEALDEALAEIERLSRERYQKQDEPTADNDLPSNP
jgi:ribosome-associated translation inhibitor RaiA